LESRRVPIAPSQRTGPFCSRVKKSVAILVVAVTMLGVIGTVS
jgi:hypothetical protein